MCVPTWGRDELKLVFEGLKKSFLEKAEMTNVRMNLEKQICNYFGVKYCIATSSGRVALEIALQALGLKKGDGVILPSFACLSVLEPILHLGCYPQFVDIDENLNLDPDSVVKTIDKNTKAIVIPHLFGKVAQIDRILDIAKKNNLFVIDDAAQTIGMKFNNKYIGTFGNAGIFSFGMFKPVTGIGGGAFLTNDGKLYEKARLINLINETETEAYTRAWKILIKTKYRKIGFFPFLVIRCMKNFNKQPQTMPLSNFDLKRISNFAAKFVLLQLPKLFRNIERKKYLGKLLFEKINQLNWIKPAFRTIDHHGFLKFVIEMKKAIIK